jgi:peptide/nickel transport system substrate-binding protein
MRSFRLSLVGLMLGIALLAAGPAAAENVLRWAGSGAAFGFDPHSMDSSFDDTLKDPVYESLIAFDSDMTMSGHLATSWRPFDTTTWEFTLRENVRFHDGTPLTADDVVFSIRRAQAETSSERDTLKKIVGVEAIDPHTVHVTTERPAAILWYDLSYVRIMSKAWAERYGVTLPADYANEERTYATDHANGTGPFILEEFATDGGYVMVRNPDWWGYERYPHNVDRLVRLPVTSTEEGVELLLRGEIDFLYGEPYQALERIERTDGLKLARAPLFNVHRLGFNHSGAELRSSDIKGRNPFRDRRVRQAVYQAIDIQTLVQEVHRGLAIPVGMPIAPGVNGHTPELGERLPYDREAAKALLAEAGYPQGFSVTLDCPNDWSRARGEALCRFIAPQLAAVGIKVALNFQPTTEHWAKLRRRETDFFMDGWIEGFDSGGTLLELYHSRGWWNEGNYANPRVDDLSEKIQQELVTYVRDAMIEEAWKVVLDDIVYVPLYQSVGVWPMREGLELPPDPLLVPHFRLARFQKVGG